MILPETRVRILFTEGGRSSFVFIRDISIRVPHPSGCCEGWEASTLE